ncbi:angiopoietin-related protein 7-like [Drosophila gunungcola]|uniref:Fibrinogen C-terminal domain-containing protein n=1 Tax=Drosophila gunungcola TaxID=103775 RepID=A0A9Q0BS95_9MUSC|nr:angiopoietin-related protein 7-like [Drosophila gunungcola]KAI8041929.1 hypothetical protein M5D96_003225 [Drosophila gunungcola]
MKSSLLVLFLSYLLLEEPVLSVADPVENLQQETKNQNSEDQCNSYCFSVFKPVLDHFVELKRAANASDELRIKINTLESSKKDLQIQLSNAEAVDKTSKLLINLKDEQIKEMSKQLKEKDDKIKNQSEQLKKNDETIRKLQGQLAIAKVQNENKDKLIRIQEDQMKDKTELIENKEELIQLKDQQIKDKDERLKIKISQINDHYSENLKNSNQINELTNQVKSVSEKLTEKTEMLSRCSRLDSCPSKGPSGIYNMKIRGTNAFEAPCNSAGWMTIQRRLNGSVDFNRNWDSYKNGFGDVNGEFFIGLQKLHLMTEAQPYELYVSLRDINGTSRYAKYDHFKVGSETESYELKTVGTYSGTAGDSLRYHGKVKFSTYDRDNDYSAGNCAEGHNGGWWFNKCAKSSLNGKYYKNGQKQDVYGIVWGTWKDFDFTISLTFAEMMIRPKSG